jgi:hypothetical protein
MGLKIIYIDPIPEVEPWRIPRFRRSHSGSRAEKSQSDLVRWRFKFLPFTLQSDPQVWLVYPPNRFWSMRVVDAENTTVCFQDSLYFTIVVERGISPYIQLFPGR